MKILIAYDGSDGAKAAITDLASAGLPEKTAAVVMVACDVPSGLLDGSVTAGDPPPAFLARARAGARSDMAAAEERAREGAKLVSDLFPAWQVSSEAVADSPYWAFVNGASRVQAGLVVVGSRGRSAIEATFLGSVSHNVLHYAPCPVRIGRASESARVGEPARLLIGFDGSPAAERAVTWVAGRSWPEGSHARIVTAAHGRTLWKLIAEGFDYEVPPMVEKAAVHLRAAGLDVSTAIRDDDPKHALVDEARRWGAHCIFTGARGLGGMTGVLLGSVSAAVAARAHCSVEVVRAAPAA